MEQKNCHVNEEEIENDSLVAALSDSSFVLFFNSHVYCFWET